MFCKVSFLKFYTVGPYGPFNRLDKLDLQKDTNRRIPPFKV